MNDIEFQLIATVDGEEVYKESFLDTASLEESGLRKAEDAVAEIIDQESYSVRY